MSASAREPRPAISVGPRPGASQGAGGGADSPCGWHGTVAEFLALDQATLLASLALRHMQVMGMRPDGLQMEAWRGEYEILGVHGHPTKTNAGWWATKITQNRERDKDTCVRLHAAGWAPVRVWEHGDPEAVASLIARIVSERRGRNAW